MKLFCLAHAGGTATTAYAALGERLSPVAETVAVDLPGRGSQREKKPETVDELTERLFASVLNRAGPDWALLGHSFGAGLAFEMARLAERHGIAPTCAILSGRSAPTGRARIDRSDVTDDALLAQVAAWGALPPEFLAHLGLRALAVARLREDIVFSDELHTREPRPLPTTPIHVLAGRDDPVAPPQSTEPWRALTSAQSTFEVLDGDHFFLFNNPAAYTAVENHLRPYTDTQSPKE